MSQMQNLVLKDRLTTNHTFVPRDVTGGVAAFVESTGVPIGERKVTCSTTRTASGRAKTTLKMTLPVVQDTVVNGVSKPVVVRTAYVDVVFSFDGTSNTGERHDSVSLLLDLLVANGVFNAIKDLESLY